MSESAIIWNEDKKMLEYYSYYPITKKRKFSIGNKAKCASLPDIKSQLPKSIVDQLLPRLRKPLTIFSASALVTGFAHTLTEANSSKANPTRST